MFLGPNKNDSSACSSDRTQLKIYRCQLFCKYFMSALLHYLLSLRILIILCIHAAVSFALAHLLILLVGALKRLRKLVPADISLMLYKAYILPYLEYCSPLLLGINKTLNKKLESANYIML